MFRVKRSPALYGRRISAGYVAAAVAVGLFIGVQLWHDAARLRQQQALIRRDSARLAQLDARLDAARRAARQARQTQTADGTGRVRRAMDVLDGIESVWQDDISLLHIDSDIGRRRLRLQVLAKSREALFQFVERMKGQFGDDVFLERHSLTTAPRDGWVINANMTVGWK